jgi:predicted O-linked N-acetylglucosamine transferase (SPINDLY family)
MTAYTLDEARHDMTQPEPEQAAHALQRLATLSFGELLAMVAPMGTNKGDPQVIESYRTWIALHGGGGPQAHAAWFNLGAEWSLAGELENAILAYRTALAIRPDFTPAAINLGLLLERGGAPEMALNCWRDALQPDESRTTLINQRARLLEQLGRLGEAEAAMRASLDIQWDQPDVIQHWLHVRQRMCQWPILNDDIRGLSREYLVANCGPLAALALTDQVAVQAQVAGTWIERKIPPAPEHLAPAGGYRHDRIRIGYMSSDFCSHAMSYLIAELFERHDRSRFEIHGYCTSPEDGSAIRQRVIAAFDHFTIIRNMPDETAARAIRADEIDILIDLNGLTTGTRMAILRWRPAPIQATYLGFIGPVPMPELDFLLCDEFVIPPAFAALYQPTPLYVAPNYQANDRKRTIGNPESREAAGLPDDRFVFCNFSNHYKITEPMFGAWLEILRRAEGSVLWLIADNVWSCDNLRARATAAGIAPERLLFANKVAPDRYMARLALPDLFLDTSPYNAGTIASDAIRMGLPMVTLSGESFASRMAGRLLQAIGATFGITESLDAYVAAAAALATQPDLLARYRLAFTETNWAATIGDIATFTFHYEQSLIQIELARRTQAAAADEPVAGTPEDLAPEDLAPAEVAPAEVAPGEVAPGEVALGDMTIPEAAAA